MTRALRRRLTAAGTVLMVLAGTFLVPERTADETRLFAHAAEDGGAPASPQASATASAAPAATATALPDAAAPAASANSAPTPVPTADGSATAQPSPAAVAVGAGLPAGPTRGDLSHLTYTATGDLRAELMTPALTDTVTSELARVAVVTGPGGGVELSVNGKPVPPSQLGARAVDKQSGETVYTYYGVRFAPGPNDVELTPLGAGDLRGAPLRRTVYGAGKPVALRASLAGELRADGTTPVLLTIHALDAWHHPALRGSPLRLQVRRGDVKLLPAPAPAGTPDPAAADATGAATATSPAPAASPATTTSPIPQAALDVVVGPAGEARVLLVPGTVSGDATVGFTSGEAAGDESVFVRPFLRRALVVGLVSAGAGAAPGSRDGDDHLDDGGSKRGRAAFFASGEALRGVSATVAYDTASRLAPSTTLGPFVDNPDERPFQTYGDTSTRRDDALSKDRLYARFERGRDAFTYGRFDADTGPREAGASAFHEVLSGAKLDLADRSGRLRLSAFSARNDVAYARRVIDASGLSTFGQLLHPGIVVGSEILTLDALDPRTGAVVAERPLQPNVDYVLDTLSGTLRFIEVPLPYDELLRRQVVVVRYQYAADAGGARTSGGKLGASFGGGLGEVNLGYVNDAGGAGSFALLQQNLRLRTGWGQFDFAHVSSAGAIPGGDVRADGHSWHAGYAAQRGPTRVTASYDRTSAGFDDPFGGLAAPGLTDQRVSLVRALPRKGELTVSYDAQRNDTGGASNAQSDASLTLRQPFSARLTLEGGFDLRRASGPLSTLPLSLDPLATPAPAPLTAASTTTTAQARVAAQYSAGTRNAIRLERIADIGGSASASQPGATTLTVDQRLGDGTRLFARELWNDAPQHSFAAATSDLVSSGATRRTTVGFERRLGAATTVSSEYTVDHTASGSDLYSAIGVREVLSLSKRLRGNAFVQSASGSSTGTSAVNAGSPGFTAYGLDLAYATERFHATSSFQDRSGSLGGTTLALGAAGALSPDMSLVGNLNSARNQGFKDTQARVGLAWRPHDDDNGAALLELERHDGTLVSGGSRTDTLAFEAAWRPSAHFEMDSRVAYKLDGDGYYAAHTMLVGLREVQRIGTRFDIGGEMRLLDAPGFAGARSTEFAAESGLRLGDHIRLAVGYNFTGASDPALAGQKTRRGIYATLTSVVSRLFGWGK